MTTLTKNLIEFCIDEWNFFGAAEINLNNTIVDDGIKKEYQDGPRQRIADYWKFIGGAYKNLNGADRGTPWSAAFISFAFHEANAGNKFPYSAGHARYINHAIKNTKNGINSPLMGRKLKGYSIKAGDLIGFWRGDKRITFENANRIGWYHSHTEIVIEVKNNYAYTIGGNVLHSVTRRQVRLNSQGHLVDRKKNWFVAIENNL